MTLSTDLAMQDCPWEKCHVQIKYGEDFLKNKGLDGTEDYFNVLTYLMEAYCEVGEFQ